MGKCSINMIGHVRGVVSRCTETGVVVDVSGVGYVISTIGGHRYSVDDEVFFYTHSHIVEQAFDLYGFETTDQLWLFRLLLSISGVGPKMALNILNLGSAKEITDAIAAGDVAYLTAVSGVGKRTAERVVVELRDKVGGIDANSASPVGQRLSDVVDALISMGYSSAQAREVVRHLDHAEKNVEDLIRDALAAVTGR
ncbi:MAG: Holliday junction branch migration protein RuvA [Parcubacteria group bacterium]|nr:Holliday junction branch migration protein RuvA [Parcubacteria group bacterium]